MTNRISNAVADYKSKYEGEVLNGKKHGYGKEENF